MAWEESISRAENEKYILELRYDMYAPNPFEFDDYYDFFKIIAFHKRYSIGYEHGYKTPEDYLRSLLEDLYTEEYIDRTLETLREKEQPYIYYEDIIYTFKKLSKKYIFLDLYLLDHSVLYLSLHPFNDSWDSGMLGWVVVDRVKMKEAGVEEDKLEEFIENHLEMYNKYLNGYIYEISLIEKVYVNSDKPEHQGLYAEYVVKTWGEIYDFSNLDWLKDELPEEAQPLLEQLIDEYC